MNTALKKLRIINLLKIFKAGRKFAKWIALNQPEHFPPQHSRDKIPATGVTVRKQASGIKGYKAIVQFRAAEKMLFGITRLKP
jgi:hypothetical protein